MPPPTVGTAALTFECPSCGALPKTRCITTSGNLTTPHIQRWRLGQGYVAGYADRQPEVDAATDALDVVQGQLEQAEADRDTALDDLGQVQTDLAATKKALTAASKRVADLTAQVAVLTARIAELEHPPPPPPPADEVLIAMDLSKVPLGPLTAAGAALIFGAPGKLANDSYWRFHTIVADPDGRRWLRWSTAKNTEGSAYGISLGIPLARRVDRCKMAYTIRFSPGFGWSYGGKLWGVSATTPGASPTAASGGHDPGPNGASSRVMWDTPGSYGSLAPLVNSLVAYWYANGKVEQNIFTRREVVAGVPVDLVLEQAMNTVGKNDGLLSLTQDGAELVRNETMPWRTDPTNQWSHLFPNEFRGGPNGDPRWAAPNDGWIDIADGLVVTTPAA